MERQAGLAPIKVCILSPEPESRERLAHESAAAGYRVEQKFSEDQQLVDYLSASSVDHIVLVDVQHQPEERQHDGGQDQAAGVAESTGW